MNFKTWLDTFLQEKGIDEYKEIEIENENGFNHMFVKNVVEFVNQLPKEQQEKIKDTFVKIDFQNGDVMHYIIYLANGMAKLY